MAKDNEKRSLLIDDDPDDQEIGRRALENGGYRVITASDGQEGIKTAEKGPPDLIITD